VNINLTLVIQMVVFALLIWFTMKVIWPPILGLMEARSKKIALGLAAAEKGQQDFANAEQRAEGVVTEARVRANEIIDQAQRRSNDMVEAARVKALEEGERLVTAARAQIDPAQGSGAAGRELGIEAAGSRDRRQGTRGPAGRTGQRDLNGRSQHHRTSLRQGSFR
jgi:F-type H+-transporting ATPase subunit b